FLTTLVGTTSTSSQSCSVRDYLFEFQPRAGSRKSMKKLILFAIASTGALSVPAQGTVSFSNRSSSGTSHVWVGPYHVQGNGINDIPAGSYDYAAAGYHLIGTLPGGLTEAQHFWSQLLGAPGSNAPETSLLPSNLAPSTFRTGAAAGNVALGTATFNNI